MATKKTVFFTSASKPATLSPFKIPKPTVSSPLPVPYNRRQYIDQEAAIQDAIFSKMGDEAKYLQQNIHEIVAEKAREAGITKSDPNWVERLRNLQKVEFSNYRNALAKYQSGYDYIHKQMEQEEKAQEKEEKRQETLQEKLDAKYLGAEARAIAAADKAMERDLSFLNENKYTPEQRAEHYNRVLAKYKDLELMKAGLEPETQILKEVPVGSKNSLSVWIKNNQDKPILQAFQEFANAPNYEYSEEDFRKAGADRLAKAFAMVARGDTAPFEGGVTIKHLTDPNWAGTADRVYLSYQPSGKTVDQMIAEMKEEEARKASGQPRAVSTTSIPDPQYAKEYIDRADRISNYVNRNSGAGEWARNLFSGPPREENTAALTGIDTTPSEYPGWQKQIIDTAGAIGSGLYNSFQQLGNKLWSTLID